MLDFFSKQDPQKKVVKFVIPLGRLDLPMVFLIQKKVLLQDFQYPQKNSNQEVVRGKTNVLDEHGEIGRAHV